ncbi:MAG: TolC family protein [Candidatus Omnitrophota bacterium]|nr:TolC family protein [Candidatus Omnitrophota bacterium]MDZ4242212.1 TolC family protein [Candidatus Omnitrophota bacterium]
MRPVILFSSFLFILRASLSWAAPVPGTPSDASAASLTLKECYRWALRQSETVAIQQKSIEEAEGRFLQSLSGVLPDVTYIYSDRRQDGRSNANGFTLREVPERKFTFSQPLFSGFKEFAAIAGSRAEKRQRRHEKRRAEETLFVDVADAFYFFLSYQEDVETLSEVRQALVDRVKELKERFDLGRSRASEVASAQARLSRIEADLESVKGDWMIARQLLGFLTGQEIVSIHDDLETVAVPVKGNDLAKAENRDDVRAAFEAWKVAQKQIVVARAGFFPEVSLDGNYYDKRVGNSSGVDWDVTLSIDVPVFRGGENTGKVRESKASAGKAQLIYLETRRRAALEIENVYTNLEVALLKEKALRAAYDAADENYRLQLDDYRKNLVNNLDVLQALEDLQEMRRAWTAAAKDTKRLYWNLLVTTGELRDTLGPVD